MSTVFTAGNNMFKHPKVLSFHGFKQFYRDNGQYLNDACTLSIEVEPTLWVGITYRYDRILYYTREGTILIPPVSSRVVIKLVNEYLPEEYRVVMEAEGACLFDVQNDAKHRLSSGDGTLTIPNDRHIVYE